MKFSYSILKKIVPSLPPIKIVAAGLSAHSFEIEEASGDMLDVKIPSNRYSDAASHIGIAREAAAIFNLKFKNPIAAIVNPPAGKKLFELAVEEPELCPRYVGRYFEFNRKIGKSPAWMQKALKTCGLKPISAVVDIMNYVMLETGQPLHAFDFDQVEAKNAIFNSKFQNKQIIVRKAKKGEKIETLDGQRFELDNQKLVIADSEKPLAIAGIKGGMGSGVHAGTKKIIVEAANFNAENIFRTARDLNLNTDASLRFSHDLSPALPQIGMDRATALLKDIGAVLKDSAEFYPRKTGDEVIEISANDVEKLLGVVVPWVQIKKYFEQLGFITQINTDQNADKRGLKSIGVNQRQNLRQSAFLVRVPAWRSDVQDKEDLIEEVARLYGLGRVPVASPVLGIRPTETEDTILVSEKVRDALINYQLDEVYNSTFMSRIDADINADGRRYVSKNPRSNPRESAGVVEVQNPISEDKKYLRPSLLPLLLKNVEHNAKFFPSVRIFEIGKVFREDNGKTEEKLNLGIVLATKKGEQLMRELKGVVGELLKSLGLMDVRTVETGDILRIESDHHVLGMMRMEKMEKQWIAATAKINLDKLTGLTEGEKEFLPLSKYPAVERDVSILVDKSVRIGEILETIQQVADFVDDVDLIDEYSDEKLGGRQSLTFRIVFQVEDRTLTDAEVNKEQEKIVKALGEKFKAVVR